MKTQALFLISALAAGALFGAPGKSDPVAEGYVNWQGVTAKNYLTGREICPSDLRHRVVAVVEIEECDALQSQVLLAGKVAGLSPLTAHGFGENWETRVMPRDFLVLVVYRGKSKESQEKLKEAMKLPKEATEDARYAMMYFRHPATAVYSGVTFEGAPDVGGSYPYVYVMGPEGQEPVYKGALTAKGIDAVKKAVATAKKKLSGVKWEPFFGSVEEPKNAVFVKAVEKGKSGKPSPLDPVAKALLKDIVSKDEEKAKEAQILFDAINQTRSDLLLRIGMEAGACPHRAAYDVQQLLLFWPGEAKKLAAFKAKIKQMPEANKLAQIFCKLMVWADPNFTCKNASDAKKIVAELNKMKKDLEKFKESKTVVVQNGALLMDGQIDELIATIPMKVPEK